MFQLVKDVLGIKSKENPTSSVLTMKTQNERFPLPVKDISDLVLGTDNKYKLIARVSPINAELLSEDDLEEVSNAIQGALSSYDGRFQIIIQSERIDIERNLKYIEEIKRQLTSELKIQLLEESKKYLISKSKKANNVLNFYFVIETKEKNYITAEQILEDYYSTIKSELESQDMLVDRLFEHDIKKLFYERMNPESSQIEPYQENWSLDNILPENAVRYQDGRHLEIENRIYRFYSITKYPEQLDKYRWLRKIFNFKGDITISITLTPKNKATIQKELSKAVSELGAKKKEKENRDEYLKQKYEAEEESAKLMIKELGSDNVTLYDTNVTIGISANNIKDLDRLSNTLRAKISSSYCQSTEIKYKGFDPFFTILPILHENRITKNYVWNLSSRDIASIIPFDSSELMEEKGVLIGENVTSRGLVIVNPFNRIYNNPHIGILADSGSGKSFWIACNIIRDLPYIDYVIQFDVDGSAKFPWATKYKFSPTSKIITNPFHIRNAIVSNDESNDGKVNIGNYLATKIMDLITFFKWILPNMTPFEEAILEEDIRDTYGKYKIYFDSKELPKEFPTMSTLAEVMEEKINDPHTSDKARETRINLKASINPYINGAYAYMFNGQTNWDYELHTIFDVSQTPEAVQKPLYEILLKDSWQFGKKDGTLDKMERPIRKKYVIDEEHIFADENNPQTLKFISTQLLKQGRKFGIQVVHATQNIADLTSIKKYGQAIIDNSFFKIFFRLGENDHETAKKLYGFSDEEMKIIKGGKNSRRGGSKGRGIFMAGSQRVVFQSVASRFELEIIDPNQYEEIYKVKSRFI